MKKLQKSELKKIKGGVEDEAACLRGCREAYTLCLTLSTLAYCNDYRNRCRLHCLGCNPICP